MRLKLYYPTATKTSNYFTNYSHFVAAHSNYPGGEEGNCTAKEREKIA